ncbi:MAG: hypothetical protein RIS35_2234 [Pseudomonadota bacterium]
MSIVVRDIPAQARDALVGAGLHPVLAQLLAARGIRDADETLTEPKALLSPDGMLRMREAACLLADHVAERRPILVVADYDCDGATACAVALRGLRMFGARVDFLVPNRFEHGYGLSPVIVDLAARHPRLGKPELIVTVDNGIASVEGVTRAAELGIRVLVTDHHLPGDVLPDAAAIIDPNQPGCPFASKHLAGVGVMFYALLALRTELRSRGWFERRPEPALQSLLDLVALGTVADLVRLDRNNRILVAAGLRRIRAGAAGPGLQALFRAAGRDPRSARCDDLGYAIGPRVNAAGRLADITLGIECLVTDDPGRAAALASELDRINRERREIEAGMREEALADVGSIGEERRTITVFRDGWHEGVIGLVASRLKERHHRPAVAFAPASGEPEMLRGSGRSIPGIHLRDVLDLVSKRDPSLIVRFGGHAMAAGMTLRREGLERFREAFEAAIVETTDEGLFARSIVTDGSLDPTHWQLRLVDELERGVWGQGFPPPLFCDEFDVVGQRLVKERHLKLDLRLRGQRIDAIAFGRIDPLPPRARLAYRIATNDYGGTRSLQLIVEAADD